MDKISVSKKKLLAISIGIVYLWFGMLKFFPGLSPAEKLAQDTITHLTFGIISPNISIVLLAIWEVTVGVLLIANVTRRIVLLATLIHLICTFTPLFFFPELSFTVNVFSFTLVGQYIMKNIIIITGLIILYPDNKTY